MMRIGELARHAGVTPRALRYYEAQGLITADRDHNGYRVYDDATVPIARDVARLLGAGLSSEDLLEFLDCLGSAHTDPGPDCAPTLKIYEDRLATLNRRIDTLTGLRDRLATELTRLREHITAATP